MSAARMSSSIRILLLAFVIVCATLLAPATSFAQITGFDRRHDQRRKRLVLPGVTVTVSGPALQRERVTATSNADGSYRVPLLPPGIYQVVFELTGFSSVTRDSIDVALNQQATHRRHAVRRGRRRIGEGDDHHSARRSRTIRHVVARDQPHH